MPGYGPRLKCRLGTVKLPCFPRAGPKVNVISGAILSISSHGAPHAPLGSIILIEGELSAYMSRVLLRSGVWMKAVPVSSTAMSALGLRRLLDAPSFLSLA